MVNLSNQLGLAGPRDQFGAVLGDSIQAMSKNFNTTGQFAFTQNAFHGHLGWLPSLTDQRIQLPHEFNFAHSGDTIDDLFSQQLVPFLRVARNVGHIFGGIGSNDMALPGFDLDQFKAKVSDLLSILLNTGAIVHWSTIWPASTEPSPVFPQGARSPEWQALVNEFNYWLDDLATRYSRLRVYDPSRVFADPASSSSNPRAGYSQDGLHPTVLGAYHVAKLLVPQFEALYPKPPAIVPGIWDQSYKPALGNINSHGNMLPGAGLLGGSTGQHWTDGRPGSPNEATITGEVPTDFYLWITRGAYGGSLSTLSVDIGPGLLADGTPCCEITVTGQEQLDESAADVRVTLWAYTAPDNVARLSAGDVLSTRVAYEISDAQGVAAVVASLSYPLPGDRYLTFADGYADANQTLPAETHGGILKTPAAILEAQPAQISSSVAIKLAAFSSAQSCKLRIPMMDQRLEFAV